MRQVILIVALLFLGLLCIAPQQAQALNQRVAVQYIRAIAVDLALTPSQINDLTKVQVATYIKNNYPSVTNAQLKECDTFWVAIKKMLSNDALARQMTTRRILLRQHLLSAYPQAVFLNTEYAKEIADKLIPLLYAEVDPNEIY
jgi:hypothetical protein